MLHADRIWVVAEVDSADELASMLTRETWCCCQAFQVKEHPRYVWLNDSTSADGAQEYGVVKLGLADGDMTQIETITFGWCDKAKALKFIKETLAGKDDNNDFARKVRAAIQQPDEHGDCHHCA